jgi:hypothetical protein
MAVAASAKAKSFFTRETPMVEELILRPRPKYAPAVNT